MKRQEKREYFITRMNEISIQRGEIMKKYTTLNLITVFIVSFMAWIYCIAVAVLGLIYNAYPGQDNISVLIATLPTVFTMIAAFAATVLFRIMPRKWLTIASMAVALVAGIAILAMDMPIWGVVICSAILGIPAGIIPGANASVLPMIAPEKLKDKVAGIHTGLMMLGMAAFTFLAGVSAGDNFRSAYKVIFVLIVAIALSIFFYPDVDRDMKMGLIKNPEAEMNIVTSGSSDHRAKLKMPPVTIIAPLVYFVGAVFWNAWYMNYSDLVINDLNIGGAALAGTIGSLGSVAGCIAGFFVAFWIKATKSWSMPLAFIITGICFMVPVMIPNTGGCYIAGFANQFFNIFIVSGLTTYGSLGTEGTRYATICMPLISVAEGGGVFLCGYLLPVFGNIFGGGPRANLQAACIIMVILGIITVFLMRPIHKQVYGGGKDRETQTNIS